jgi:lipopolysaccharide export system permease protein
MGGGEDGGAGAARSTTIGRRPAMNGVERYILAGLAKAMAAVLLVTVSVVCLVRSIEFINYIVNHGLSVAVYLYLIVLLMPSLMLLVLPIALFLSVLFVYGRLSQDSEILAMRACGLSLKALSRPACIVAAATIALAFSMSLYFIPLSFKEFKDIEYFVRFRLANMVIREGQFNRLGDKITVYMRERSGDGVLVGVLIQDDRDPKKSVTVVAERAVLTRAGDLYKIGLEQGNIQDFERATQKVTVVYFDRYVLEVDSAELDGGGRRERGIAERHIGELLDPPTATRRDLELRGKALAEGHQRLSSPFLALTYTAIALATLFVGSFNRRGSPARLVAAGAGVAAIQVAHMLVVNAASLATTLLPAIHLVVGVPALLCAWLLLDQDRHAPRPPRLLAWTRRGPTPAAETR